MPMMMELFFEFHVQARSHNCYQTHDPDELSSDPQCSHAITIRHDASDSGSRVPGQAIIIPVYLPKTLSSVPSYVNTETLPFGLYNTPTHLAQDWVLEAGARRCAIDQDALEGRVSSTWVQRSRIHNRRG
ncbi:hypothetical protein ACJZ2D_002520 [Fusarium nematophilum]